MIELVLRFAVFKNEIVNPRVCAHRPGNVHTPSQKELKPQAPTGGVCPATRECAQEWGSVCTHQSLCAPTGECLHLISEGVETTGTGESVNQGRRCVHTHSPEEAYHKKEWVEAGNTRITTRTGNPPTKETPTDKKRTR